MKYTHTVTDLAIENRYPKLIRDRIPEIVERNGQKAVVYREEDTAKYLEFLFTKLIEEATELVQADSLDHQREELADVREVLATIQNTLGLAESDIAEVQASKREGRGGFEGRLIMESKPE